MKKLSAWTPILLILAIKSLYLWPLFQAGMFLSHDGLVEIARAAARIESLSDGQFPPRWAGDLNWGYGSPEFIFFYSLSEYLVALFHVLKIGLETSYKILLGLTFVISPAFFYLWVSQIFKKRVALIASLFFGLAPYIFLDTFVRGHLGESLALAFPPVILYFIEKNCKKISFKNIIIAGIAYALLIHSHTILSLLFSFVIFGYILLRGSSNRKVLVSNLSILVVGLLLSFYFWFPALMETKYISNKVFLVDWYKNNFLDLSNIVYSKWGFGSDVNKPEGLSAQIGPLHFAFALFCIPLFLFKKSKERLFVAYWLLVFFIAIFMSTSVSDFLWSRIYLLQQIQFPWRFTAISSFAASVLAGYFFSKIRSNKIFILTMVILILLSIPMSKTQEFTQRPDGYYFGYYGTTAYHNETTTIWVAGSAYKFPKQQIEVISGKAEIANIYRKSNLHTFNVNGQSESGILDNTVYFPGWRANVDNKKVPIEFQDMNHRGLITFDVPKGQHSIKVEFGESPIRLFADIVSLITITFAVFAIAFRKRINAVFNSI